MVAEMTIAPATERLKKSAVQVMAEQLALSFDELQNVFYAKLVTKVGTKRYWGAVGTRYCPNSRTAYRTHTPAYIRQRPPPQSFPAVDARFASQYQSEPVGT